MMEQHETDWRTILLLVGAAGGAVLAYSTAGLIILFAGVDTLSASAGASGRSAFDYFVLAAAPLVIGTIFLPAIYYSIRRLIGRPAAATRPVTLGRRTMQGPVSSSLLFGLIVALVWIGIAVLAGRLVTNPTLRWITPPLYVLAILIPAGFFLWIATRGLNPGSPQRRWGVLAAGIGLGIVPAMVIELMLIFVVVIAFVIYLAFNPAQLATVQNLARELQNPNDIGQVISAAGPLLSNPLVLVLVLVFFSGLSPLIEETSKSLATWTVFDQLTSPAQGFAIGAISGAAFGLVESLLVSAQPDSSWATTLLVRGASTMMHIMAAALTGLGIGQFRTTRRIAPLIGMYVLAMGLHGLWNGSVVAITVGSIRSATVSGGRDLAGMLLVYVGAAVLVVLCVAIPVAMWIINWRLRSGAAASSAGAAAAVEAEVHNGPAAEPENSGSTNLHGGEGTSSSPPVP